MASSESPRVLAVARSIRDSEVEPTPEIVELRRRRDQLNQRQAAAWATAQERAEFVQQQRAQLDSLRTEFGSLASARPSLAAAAFRSGDFAALERHEEAQRAKG